MNEEGIPESKCYLCPVKWSRWNGNTGHRIFNQGGETRIRKERVQVSWQLSHLREVQFPQGTRSGGPLCRLHRRSPDIPGHHSGTQKYQYQIKTEKYERDNRKDQ